MNRIRLAAFAALFVAALGAATAVAEPTRRVEGVATFEDIPATPPRAAEAVQRHDGKSG